MCFFFLEAKKVSLWLGRRKPVEKPGGSSKLRPSVFRRRGLFTSEFSIHLSLFYLLFILFFFIIFSIFLLVSFHIPCFVCIYTCIYNTFPEWVFHHCLLMASCHSGMSQLGICELKFWKSAVISTILDIFYYSDLIFGFIFKNAWQCLMRDMKKK